MRTLLCSVFAVAALAGCAACPRPTSKMFRWRKLGRVFDPREVDIEWMRDFAQAPSALVLDDRSRASRGARQQRAGLCRCNVYSGVLARRQRNG